MKKVRVSRCTLLKGSTWSSEKKVLGKTKESATSFFVEHRLRKEDIEEQFDREAKEGWRLAANAARITDERASSEDRQHTSGGVFVAVDSNLGAVVGAEEGTIVSIPGNEGRIVQTRVNVRGGLWGFSRCTSGTQKPGPRGMKPWWKQFLSKQKHPDTRGWQRVMQTCVRKTSKRACGFKGIGCMWWLAVSEEKSQMKVVEDFESRPHKAVSSVVGREEEIQEWKEQATAGEGG